MAAERQKISFDELVGVYKEPKLLDTLNGFNIVEYYNVFYGIPCALGPIDFNRLEHKDHPAILMENSKEDITRAIKDGGKEIIRYLSTHKHPKRIEEYKRYSIIEYLKCLYAVPQILGRVDFTVKEELNKAAIIKGASVDDIKRLIDERGVSEPEIISTYGSYKIVAYTTFFFGVHLDLGNIDLTNDLQRNNLIVLKGRTVEEVRRLIDEYVSLHELLLRLVGDNESNEGGADFIKSTVGNLRKVEYAGWLPAFITFGNCGKHPQFMHLDQPPDGYAFVISDCGAKSPQPIVLRIKNCLTKLLKFRLIFTSILRLFFVSILKGASIRETIEFIKTRGLRSQFLLPRKIDLAFLPSVPFTYGQHNWVIEIEDTVSMFFPFLHNGKTIGVDKSTMPCRKVLKSLLESHNCRGIITHMKSTADSIPLLFDSKTIASKVTYIPLGIKIPQKIYIRDKRKSDFVNLLFTNSWHQNPISFFLRGGLDALEAFELLDKKYLNIRLIMRTAIPPNLSNRYLEILKKGNIQIIDYFLSSTEMQSVLDMSDILILPSARIHAISILQAMANGLALIVSDGWGIEEYITHMRNGIVLKGRYGNVTYMDEETGILRENYVHMFKSDPQIVEGLITWISRLIDDKEMMIKLGEKARDDVKNIFSMENWNKRLKEALDITFSGK